MPAQDSPLRPFGLEEIVEAISGGDPVHVVTDQTRITVQLDEDDGPSRLVQFDLDDVQEYLSSFFPPGHSRAGRRQALELFGTHVDEFLGTTFAIGDPVVIDRAGLRLTRPVPEAFDDVPPTRADGAPAELFARLWRGRGNPAPRDL